MGSQDYSYFTGSFKPGDTTQLFHIKVERDKTASQPDFERIKSIALQQIGEKAHKVKERSIVISKKELAAACSPTLTDANAKTSLKIVQLATALLPKRKRTFDEIYRSLRSYLKDIPIISIIWALIVLPIAILARFLYPGYIFDQTSLQIKRDPHHEHGLEDALHEVVELLQSQYDTESQELQKLFSQGLERATKWRTATTQERYAMVQSLTDQIVKNSSQNQASVVIPGGYWKDDQQFQPVLWSFYTNAQGKLCLSEMTYGVDEGTRNYEFDTRDLAKIKILLLQLMNLSSKPKLRAVESSQLYGAIYATILGDQFPAKEKEGAAVSINAIIQEPQTFERFKEALVREAGGHTVAPPTGASAKEQAVKEEVVSRYLLREDPIKLVHEIIRKQFPNVPIQEKTLFTLHILHRRLSRVLAALPEMTREEKVYWLNKFERELESLKGQLGKSGYGAEALQYLDSFSAHVNHLQKELEALKKEDLKLQAQRIKKLNHVPKSHFQLFISPDKIKSTQELPKIQGARLAESHYKDLAVLESALKLACDEKSEKSTASIPTIVDKLHVLTDEVNRLVDIAQYETAMALYRAVMRIFPDPSTKFAEKKVEKEEKPSVFTLAVRKLLGQLKARPTLEIVHTGFWKTLETTGKSSENLSARSNQIKSISDELGKLSQYFWESKLKSGNMKLSAEEMVDMMSTGASLYELLQLRTEMINKLKSDPLVKLSTEEELLTAVGQDLDKFRCHGAYFVERFQGDQFLRCADNPALARRFSKLRDFFFSIRGFDADHSRDEASHEGPNVSWTCQKILIAKKGFKSVDFTATIDNQKYKEADKAIAELEARFFERDSAKQALFVPTQYSDLARHEILFSMLLSPMTYISKKQSDSESKREALKIASSNITSETLAAQNFEQALKILQQKKRLNIAVKRDGTMQYFGIVGKDEIGPFEIEVHNWDVTNARKKAGMERRQKMSYRESLGNPSDIYLSRLVLSTKKPIDDNMYSEAAFIRRVLNSDTMHPFDEIALKLLKALKEPEYIEKNTKPGEGFDWFLWGHGGTGNYLWMMPQSEKSVHEVFNLLLQRPWILESKFKNHAGVESYEGLRRVYGVLFDQGAIESVLQHQPELFLSHAPHFKQLLDKSIKEKRTVYATALLYLMDNIFQRIPGQVHEAYEKIKECSQNLQLTENELNRVEAELKQKNISYSPPRDELAAQQRALKQEKDRNVKNLDYFSKITKTWPKQDDTYDGSTYFKELFQQWVQGAGSIGERADQASYLLSLYTNRITPLEVTDDNTRLIAQLMKLGSFLELCKTEVTLPIVAEQALAWLKEQLIPQIEQQSEGVRNRILNSWLAEKATGGTWQRVPGQPFVWQQDKLQVDLGTLQLLTESKGIALTNIPHEISRTSDFQLLFGKETIPCTIGVLSQPGQFEVNFKDRQGQEHRVLYNSSSKTSFIEKRISDQWFRFYHPQIAEKAKKEASALERRLADTGVWINLKDTRKGKLFLGKAPPVEYDVAFDPSGQLQTIHTTDGLEVVNDSKKEFAELLTCLPHEQILFLRKPGAAAITEIHIANQSFVLKRESENKWVLSGDTQLEGAEWVMGEARGAVVNNMLKSLGASSEQIGIAVRKENRTHLLMWPQQATNRTNHKHPRMEFMTMEQTQPPLRLSISDKHEVISSAAGFANLAYLYALRHDYVNAALYLDRARVARFATDTEIDQLLIVQNLFNNLLVTSARSAAIKLKGLLAIRQIVEEQTLRTGNRLDEWKQHLATNQELQTVFEAYQQHLKRSPFGGQKQRELPEITFTAPEQIELESIVRESLSSLVVDRRRLALEQKEKLSFAVPVQPEVEFILPLLISSMNAPVKDLKKLLDELPFNPDLATDHFFELYNAILRGEVAVEQLQPLFSPIKEKESVLTESEIRQMAKEALKKSDVRTKLLTQIKPQVLEIARRILLSAKVGKGKEIDLKAVQKLQNSLPWFRLSVLYTHNKYEREAKRKHEIKQTIEQIERRSDYKFVAELRNIQQQLVSTEAGKVYTLAGVDKTPEVAASKQVLDLLKQGQQLDIKHFAETLEKENGNLFGPHVTPLLRILLTRGEFIRKLEATEAGIVSVDQFVKVVEQVLHINLIEALRSSELQHRIQQTEQSLKARPPMAFPVEDNQIDTSQLTAYALAGSSDYWEKEIKSEASQHIKSMQAQFATLESKALKENIETSAEELQKTISNRTALKPDQLPKLKDELTKQISSCRERLRDRKTALLDYLQKHPDNLPDAVKKAIRYLNQYGQEALLQLLQKHYQHLTLNDPQASQLLTLYLLEKSALGVLTQEVADQVRTLELLTKQGVKETADEWIAASTRVKDLTGQALNYRRHLTDDTFKNPQLYRKVLVLEAQRGIIVTKDQIDLIQEIYRNPFAWYELKVGKGKTSVVMPLILMMLIESGRFPTALLKEELLRQNFNDLDSASRSLVESAGVEFQFHVNAPTSALTLQEQYLRLLRVQQNGGYVVTSRNSLIALAQKMQLLNDQLIKRNSDLNNILTKDQREKFLARADINEKNFDALQPHLAALQEIDELERSIDYLRKIYDKLNLLIADEVDDIFNVINNNIIGKGNPIDFDQTIREVTEEMMKVILTSENPEVKQLKEALQKGRQATLSTERVQKIVQALVQEMLHDPKFAKAIHLQLPKDEVQSKLLVEQLCTVFESNKETPFPPFAQTASRHLNAIQHIMQSTLPVALKQNPGISVAIKKSDGFQVGPHANSKEIQGTVFSDEYDLIVNHYLTYVVQIPETARDFVERGLREIREKDPDVFEEWAKHKDIFAFLNQPENYKERIYFINRQIFDERRIRRFQRQIVFNVQDIFYDRKVGGMTGTLDLHALPATAETKAKESFVTGQVILEAGLLHVPSVTEVSEENLLDAMQSCISERDKDGNYTYKALINQGYHLESGNTRALVTRLRGKKTERTFVYVDSDSRKIFIWEHNQPNPREITKPELERRVVEDADFKRTVCFCFNPADTRGTDFRIPPGKAATFISPTCSMDDFIQTLGRMRKAGETQSMDFFVSTGLANRIREEKKALNYASLVGDIDKQDKQQQQGKHLQTAIQGMRRVVNMGTRALLTRPQEGYWKTRTPISSFLNTQITKILTGVANDEKTGWLEESRESSLETPFSTATQEDTMKYLTKVRQAELHKIERLEAAIKTIQLTVLPLLAEQDELFKKQSEAMLKARVESLTKMTAEMAKQLEAAFTLAKAKFDLPQVLSKTVPSTTGGLPTALAQVQEVQQQQVQQQQQMQQQMMAQEQSKRKIVEQDADDTTRKLEPIPFPFGDLPFWRFYAPDIKASKNFISVYELLQGVKGNPGFCRLYRTQKHTIRQAHEEFILISRNDYHHLLPEPGASNIKYSDTFYSLIDPELYGQSLVVDQTISDDPDLLDLPPNLFHQLIRIKWFLGMSQYTPKEKEQLKKWFKEIAMPSKDLLYGITWKGKKAIEHFEEFIAKHATDQQRKLYENELRFKS